MELEAPVALSSNLFNASNFELVVVTGAQMKSRRADIPDSEVVTDQRARLFQLGIPVGAASSNMVGFAVGATRHKLSDYTDTDVLAASFEAAHKLLFALAMNSLFSASTTSSDPRKAIVSCSISAIVVVRTLSLIVEGVLGLITVLTFALFYFCWSRPSQLHQDPASLNDLMSMVDPKLPASTVQKIDLKAEGSCVAKLVQGKIQLCTDDCFDEGRLQEGNGRRKLEKAPAESPANSPNPDTQLVRPWEISMIVGIIFVTVLLLALVALVALQITSEKHLGLALSSSSSVINQLITNYVPVVFATFLELFWLLLNRILCILRPFEELRVGDARPSKSINLKYTSLPPQMVIWRALRARHFLLAAVCAIGLSANVMSVALSGLFQTSVNPIASGGTFKPQYQPMFDQSTLDLNSSDPSYVAKANISDGTSLPPWISRERYFLPFTMGPNLNPNDSTTKYKALTRGFGVSLNCVPADYNSTAFMMAGPLWTTGASTPVVVPQQITNGRDVTCSNTIQGPFGGQNNSKAAVEVLQPLTSSYSSREEETDDICDTLLLSGFLRANLTVSVENMKTDNTEQDQDWTPTILAINSLSSLWMVCQPTLHTSAYSVTVDRNGRVQEYAQVGPETGDLTQFFSNSSSLRSIIGQTRRFWGSSTDTMSYWHNDTFVDTWFAYFVKEIANSTVFVDPEMPEPTFDAIAPIVEDIYTRVFAIILGLDPTCSKPHPQLLSS